MVEPTSRATKGFPGQGRSYESIWAQILRATSAFSVSDQNQATLKLRGPNCQHQLTIYIVWAKPCSGYCLWGMKGKVDAILEIYHVADFGNLHRQGVMGRRKGCLCAGEGGVDG